MKSILLLVMAGFLSFISCKKGSNQNDFWNSGNWNRFKSELKVAIANNVEFIKSKYPDFYGYSILPGEPYNNGNGSVINMHLIIAYNNISDIKEDEIYYKYSVDEWEHYDNKSLESITPIIKSLYSEFEAVYNEKSNSSNPKAEMKLINKFQGTILSVLKELKNEGLFNLEKNNPFLVIWISDSESEIIYKSVKELNSQDVIEEFEYEFH
ncbi:hypothetical protein GCM10011414_17600 [Croceivirga lutea]|uniref:DUF4303 domain-containing protein n=1 Tax=Croceivirga lutea TaxID=1775167 RepID=UPI001639E885|nr:DUF4303 domain-containing protein [Croceivirga lutea]GGG48308.1 hypothetical protein GCM10011414_17600 [Croceivirga lutea]